MVKMGSEMKNHAAAIAWYKEEQYEDFRTQCEDGGQLPASYNDWLVKAREGFEKLTEQGYCVIRIMMDMDEFKAWCQANGHKLDKQGRAAFGNYKAAVQLGLLN